MNASPGTYALVLHCQRNAATQVGRWGRLDLKKGCYIYVGSAFGPGGVRARVTRHCRRDKPSRWHIDYLREFVTPLGAWYSYAPQQLEHRWAQCLGGLHGLASIPKFGCSDCRCEAHLFYTASKPDLAGVLARAGGAAGVFMFHCAER
jgi:Uri superfamily endonuclease